MKSKKTVETGAAKNQFGPPVGVITPVPTEIKRVRRGETLNFTHPAIVVDSTGNSVPGYTPRWTLNTTPAIPDATVTRWLTSMHGEFNIPNVQSNFRLDFTVTVAELPQFSASSHFDVMVL